MALRAILGGTFNPPHYGHIKPSLSLLDAIGVSSLGLMPCKIAPHKKVAVNEQHRVNMVKLCCTEDPRLYLEPLELSLPGPSYTVRTLECLQQKHQDSICFFIGADSLYNIESWFEWERLLDYCHLVVMRRDGERFAPPSSIVAWLDANKTDDYSQLHDKQHGCVILADTPLHPVSSTDLRNAVASTSSTQAGLLKQWVPPKVIDYIDTHQLYQDLSN
jgi:nicotinate-nucleotide adenylyltransferase